MTSINASMNLCVINLKLSFDDTVDKSRFC